MNFSMVFNYYKFLLTCSLYYYCYSWKIKHNETELVQNIKSKCSTSAIIQNEPSNIYVDDITCEADCKIKQFTIGCNFLDQALDITCQTLCNISQSSVTRSSNLFCFMGCKESVDIYFDFIKDDVKELKAPVMLDHTLTSSSLSLQWDETRFRNESYILQCRDIDLADSWQFCRNQSWLSSLTVEVKHLKPFTKYQFRIAMRLIPDDWYDIYSEPSSIIATLPSDLPFSPNILSATVIDCNKVSLLWEQDSPNGPIISYIIRTNELPAGIAAVKDIPVTEGTHSYMIQNLQPSKSFSISVSARNNIGLGSPATVTLRMPECNHESEKEGLNLIVATQHTIYSINSEIDNEPVVMYNTTHIIKGIALHIHRDLVFICDSSGSILVTSSKGMLSPQEVVHQKSAKPLDLTIDWLNDHIYILNEVLHPSGTIVYQVSRCGLDGTNFIIVLFGFIMKPHHIEVDPYNGYLFWVVRGIGLYRLDLIDISKSVNQNVSPELIIEDINLGVFLIDYNHFRILILSHSQNAIVSSSLNGRDIINFRNNIHDAQFQNVNSLAIVNGLLYWTDSGELYGEIYDTENDAYGHRKILNESFVGNYISVVANALSSQPIPIPLNPPADFHVIFGYDIVKVSWNIPYHLAGQGDGAWSSWSYRLFVQDVNTSELLDYTDIKGTQFTVTDLKHNTEYKLKVSAYTTSGQGPWSNEFVGKTMSRNISMLWSTEGGLLITDITGYRVNKIEPINAIETDSHILITDIDWYEHYIYVSTNDGYIYGYNLLSNTYDKMQGVTGADCLAIEWIGQKIYWANRQKKLIFRSDIDGKKHEILPFIAAVNCMFVDSLEAYLYWSTRDRVERAHFDGSARSVYFSLTNLFTSTIVGLSMDIRNSRILWISRHSDNPTHILLTADVDVASKKGGNISVHKFSLTKKSVVGDICNVDQQLVWIRSHDKNAMISVNGSTSAVIHSDSLSHLLTCTAMDPFLRTIPTDLSTSGKLNVIPSPVLGSSIHIKGSYDLFNITWSPVTNVDYGKVYYRIRIIEQHHDTSTITDEAYITIGNSKAYIPLKIAIQSKTYWSTAEATHVTLYSPPTTPSAPTHPRAFVAHKRNPLFPNKDITTIFRWSPPAEPNGVVQRYELYCSTVQKNQTSSVSSCSSSRVSSKTLEYSYINLLANNTYVFKVRACTQVGCGIWSSTVEVDFEEESPIPKLLVITANSLSIMDYDRKTFGIAITGVVNITAVAFDGLQNVVYWIENNCIYQSFLHLHLANKNEVISMNSKGHSLAFDWIARILYWVESNVTYSQINVLDLNVAEINRKTRTILSRPASIDNLLVSPLHSLLIWVEISNEHYTGNTLLKSNIDGSNIKQFFAKRSSLTKNDVTSAYTNEEQEKSCNCSFGPFVGTAISLLPSLSNNGYKLLWVDFLDSNIIVSDMEGCHCSVLVRCTHTKEHGLPPESLTADFSRLYWIDSSKSAMYSTVFEENIQIDKLHMNGVIQMKEIVSFGTHVQQYPPSYCLWPNVKAGVPHLLKHSSDTIILELPTIERKRNCSSVSMATIEYTLYYDIIHDDGTSNCTLNVTTCSQLVTYDKIIAIQNLKPYTRYVFMVGVINYYGRLQNTNLLIGLPAVYRTAPGVPSPPRNITALPINPNVIFVKWLPPEEINAELIWYEIHWKTSYEDRDLSSDDLTGEHVVSSMTSTSTTIGGLLPDTDYYVKVRAYAHRNNNYSESNEILVTTYSEPQNLTLLNVTARSLVISLPTDLDNIRYEVECYNPVTSEWHQIPRQKDFTYLVMKDLQPISSYTFRLKIWYTVFHEPYIWPLDNRFTYQTIGDRPDKPGIPMPEYGKDDSIKLHWDVPYNNGGKIDMYSLEAKVFHKNEKISDNENWFLYFNGTDNFWIVWNLKYNTKYRFRVKARNKYGWSDYSRLSEEIEIISKSYWRLIAFWFIIPLFGLIFVSTLTVFIYIRSCRRISKKTGNSEKRSILSISQNGEFELANLRELPSDHNFTRNTNMLYSIRMSTDYPTNEEISQLPHVRRDQITLTKFLGSGAFGEVYEGTVKNILYENIETKVAIKLLHKNATEQEKLEFMKEAQLMSNFKHNHILQMLGICVDNNPHYIIIELMEGGDLLSFLRSSRTPSVSGIGALSILDLLDICVDVASGCKYLEEMHFVHRDLACRNCLVSSRDPEFRVVKIGDFGLARDIYKNDYYRKEGEGLLPVRWMAPESLVDGVFTRQSDVWSFGVLLWEVMSLGQQPYPARSNVEVLQYVRTGGRLPCPINCMPSLHELMVKCWSFNPKSRPTFKFCLSALEDLKRKICPSKSIAINYATLLPITDDNDDDDDGTINCQHQLLHDSQKEYSHNVPQNYANLDNHEALQ